MFYSRHYIKNILPHSDNSVRDEVVHHRVGGGPPGDITKMPHPVQLEAS